MLQAYRFALDPTPAQARALASHCGAARKAFNEGLAQVKRCLDQRAAERSYGVPEDAADRGAVDVAGAAPVVEPEQGRDRAVVARRTRKEAYNSGLDALARGLKQYSASRSGKRRGPKIGFPRFKTRRRSRMSCRFTTGAIRVAGPAPMWCCPALAGSRPTSRAVALLARSAAGTARILAATVRFDGAALAVRVHRRGRSASWARPAHVALAGRTRWSAWTSGCEICWWPPRRTASRWRGCPRRRRWRGAGPAAGGAAQGRPPGSARTGAPGRRASKRWQRTAARIGRIHARAANLRRDVLHKATTDAGAAAPGDRGRGPQGGRACRAASPAPAAVGAG